MKITLVTDFPIQKNNPKGGVQSSSEILVNILSMNNELTVIAPGKSFGDIEYRDNITIYWIGISILPGFLRYWTIENKRINQILNIISPDIVHFHGKYGWTRNCKYKYICTIHGFLEKDILLSSSWVTRYIKYYTIKNIENFYREKTQNHAILNRYVLDSIPTLSNKNLYWYKNPINKIFFNKKNNTKNLRNILFVGKISKAKNPLDVIICYSKSILPQNKIKLLLAGPIIDLTYYQKCIEYIKENNLESMVIFLGDICHIKLSNFYKESICTISFSIRENCPMFIAESMASSTPVIAINDFGIKYMIKNNITGYLLDKGNIMLAASLLNNLYLDNKLLIKLSINCYEYALNTYHDNIISNDLIRIYKAITDESK